MGRLVFGMMQSLDGYVAGAKQTFPPSAAGGPQLPPPGERLARHFTDHIRGVAGMIFGRRMYEIMRYWDDSKPDWDAGDHDFAAAWRSKPKWVASRTLQSVGPNATLIRDDVGAFVRELKAKLDGEIDVAGPDLAGSLTALGLIDEYRLYLRPFVLGGGKPYFSGPRPRLHLVASESVGEDTVRLTYVI
jgi:dihydrofolate reductase